jgi:hypothetical protein
MATGDARAGTPFAMRAEREAAAAEREAAAAKSMAAAGWPLR